MGFNSGFKGLTHIADCYLYHNVYINVVSFIYGETIHKTTEQIFQIRHSSKFTI